MFIDFVQLRFVFGDFRQQNIIIPSEIKNY